MANFICSHCQKSIETNNLYGTNHRNHCPYCLWSLHKDEQWPGDRKSTCLKEMEPIALTFKHEGVDKYTGKTKQGETMIVHHCLGCDKISINRIGPDDKPDSILEVLKSSQALSPEIRKKLEEDDIKILTEKDETEIKNQLYGKS
jgi:hypothetical protein